MKRETDLINIPFQAFRFKFYFPPNCSMTLGCHYIVVMLFLINITKFEESHLVVRYVVSPQRKAFRKKRRQAYYDDGHTM